MSASDKVERFLGWEDNLFGWAWRGFRSLTGRGGPDEPDPSRAAMLSVLLPRLSVLAQVAAEQPVRLKESEGLGGVRGPVLLLPRAVELAESPEANRQLYVLRTLLTAELVRQGHSGAGAHEGEARTNPLVAQVRYALAARAAQDALRALPGFEAGLRGAWPLLSAALVDSLEQPKLGRGLKAWTQWLLEIADPAGAGEQDELFRVVGRLREAGVGTPAAWPALLHWGAPLSQVDEEAALEAEAAMGDDAEHADGTEHEGPTRDEVKRILLEKTEEVEPMPIHSFEKAECLDSYRGGKRKVDGDDELDEHLEALSEVDLREVFRGGKDTHSVLKADIDLGGIIPDVERVAPGEKGVPYDEWDVRKGRYLRDWVTVYPARFEATEPGWGARVATEQRRVVKQLVGRISRERTKRQQARRQLDGDAIDLAAWIDERGLRAAGRPAPGRVYQTTRRWLRDTACTVLLDMSLSSGSWIEGRCVLDLTREAVIVLGEVTAELGDPLQVLGFGSHTRNLCRVWELKGFGESWPEGRARLGAVVPRGYTRMGGPIRHATQELLKAPQRHKLLLVVTDGKPSDYDRYEGEHGRADVRQAVREAARDGVIIHALAYDPSARAQIPPMFGPGGFTQVRHPEDLSAALAEAFGRRSSRS